MKILHPSVSFNAATKTVTLIGLNITQSQLLLITNVTDGVVIYNFADSTKGSTSFTPGADTVVVLEYDTTTMDNADKLAVHYDDAKPVNTVSPADTAVCSFGRLRTSDPGYRFDAQFTNGVQSDLWDTKTTGTASTTFSTTERWVNMTGGTSAGAAVIQSHYPIPYTPGRGTLAFITSLVGSAPSTNAYKRVGLFDGTNGVYLERTSTAVNLVLKSSTSKGTETIPQASWNLDTLGAGSLNPSGHTLDLTKVQILVIQMQALYVGRVVVGFDIGGKLVPVHQFTCANEEGVPYIATASLPVRFECGCTGTAVSAPVIYAICSSVQSEGGRHLGDIDGREFSVTSAFTVKSVGTSAAPVISLRCLQTINSTTNTAVTIPQEVAAFCRTNDTLFRVLLNATLTNASFAAVSSGSSVMEYDVAADGVSGGTLVDTIYLPAAAAAKSSTAQGILGKVAMAYSHLLGVGDTLTVTAQSRTATAEAFASIKWKEIR